MHNRRVWLNKEDCFYTGSIVTYHGPDNKSDDGYYSFIEISDCHNKIRLHPDNVNWQAYIDKIELLRYELDTYLKYLKENTI